MPVAPLPWAGPAAVPPFRYCPGSDGVVLLVDSGVRTAHSWANHRRLGLRGIAVTPPIVLLQTRTVGSAKSGQRDHVVPQLGVGLVVEDGRLVRVQLLGGRLHQVVERAVGIARPVL